LENTKEVVTEFERKLNAELIKQEKLKIIKKRDLKEESY